MSEIFTKIQQIIDDNKVVLFMKGTKTQPQCGFSNLVVQILNKFKINFYDVDVLQDENIRQGIKDFTKWPTVPQLYINKEFIGGADIVKAMYSQNELQEMLIEQKIISSI